MELPKIYDHTIDDLRDVTPRDIERFKDMEFMVGQERLAYQCLARVATMLACGIVTTNDVSKALRPLKELSQSEDYVSCFKAGEIAEMKSKREAV